MDLHLTRWAVGRQGSLLSTGMMGLERRYSEHSILLPPSTPSTRGLNPGTDMVSLHEGSCADAGPTEDQTQGRSFCLQWEAFRDEDSWASAQVGQEKGVGWLCHPVLKPQWLFTCLGESFHGYEVCSPAWPGARVLLCLPMERSSPCTGLSPYTLSAYSCPLLGAVLGDFPRDTCTAPCRRGVVMPACHTGSSGSSAGSSRWGAWLLIGAYKALESIKDDSSEECS